MSTFKKTEKKLLIIRKEKDKVNKIAIDDQPEFFGQIIDIFENFLEEKKIDIPNKEREDYEAEDAAIIFGSDYDNIKDSLENMMKNWELTQEAKQ